MTLTGPSRTIIVEPLDARHPVEAPRDPLPASAFSASEPASPPATARFEDTSERAPRVTASVER